MWVITHTPVPGCRRVYPTAPVWVISRTPVPGCRRGYPTASTQIFRAVFVLSLNCPSARQENLGVELLLVARVWVFPGYGLLS